MKKPKYVRMTVWFTTPQKAALKKEVRRLKKVDRSISGSDIIREVFSAHLKHISNVR